MCMGFSGDVQPTGQTALERLQFSECERGYGIGGQACFR
jgi:hypothetical protein